MRIRHRSCRNPLYLCVKSHRLFFFRDEFARIVFPTKVIAERFLRPVTWKPVDAMEEAETDASSAFHSFNLHDQQGQFPATENQGASSPRPTHLTNQHFRAMARVLQIGHKLGCWKGHDLLDRLEVWVATLLTQRSSQHNTTHHLVSHHGDRESITYQAMPRHSPTIC